MLLLGMLLVGATAAFTGLLISGNLSGGPAYGVTVLGNHIATLSTLGAFLAGLALALVFCLGLAMMTGGAARGRHRRNALRTARRDAADARAERDVQTTAVPRGTGGVHGGTGAAEGAEPAATTKPQRRHGLHLFGH